ncbi:hypothetical protein ACFE04_029227 [Oxalis oulophora]
MASTSVAVEKATNDLLIGRPKISSKLSVTKRFHHKNPKAQFLWLTAKSHTVFILFDISQLSHASTLFLLEIMVKNCGDFPNKRLNYVRVLSAPIVEREQVTGNSAPALRLIVYLLLIFSHKSGRPDLIKLMAFLLFHEKNGVTGGKFEDHMRRHS